MKFLDREYFKVMLLNTKISVPALRLALSGHECFFGTSLEIFKQLMKSAASLILAIII